MLYFLDYYLTILGARYYKSGVCDHIVFEGSYELTPELQSDVDTLRMFSPKFIRAVLISSALIVFLWYGSKTEIVTLFFLRFLVGGLIVREIAVLVRHVRNIVLFRFANAHKGVSGQIRYEKWLSYRMSGFDLSSFAGVFLVVYLFSGSVSFLGGAVLTALSGLEHFKLSGKAKEKKDQAAIIKILLIVVVLLVVGLWIITPRMGHSRHPQLAVAKADIQNICSALDTYRDGHGSYPSEEQGLSVLPSDIFIKGMLPQYRPKGTTNSFTTPDPWGTPFRYRVIAGKPIIRSAGPDAQFDTKDDITN